MPSQVIEFQTPYQKLQTFFETPHQPNLEPRIFGCTVYVHTPKVLHSKLDPYAQWCVFVGYSDFQKGYRCCCPHTRKLHVSIDVSFRETTPYYLAGDFGSPLKGEKVYDKELETVEEGISNTKQNITSPVDTQIIPDERNLLLDNDVYRGYADDKEVEHHDRENTEMIESCAGDTVAEAVNLDKEETAMIDIPAPQTKESSAQNVLDNLIIEDIPQPAIRYSQRPNKGVKKKQYEPDIKTNVKYPISNYVSANRLSKSYALTINQLSKVSIPSNVQDALEDPKWKKAMNEEMEALQKTSTWELVVLLEGKKAIGCRWVYTVKLKANGSLDRYKARL